jgi:hypothetical protein
MSLKRPIAMCLLCLTCVVLSSCNIGTLSTQVPSPTLPGIPSQVDCNPPTTIGTEQNPYEVQVDARGNTAPQKPEVWALLMPTVWPPRVDTLLKVVWRLNGQGDLNIVAVGPNGSHLAPHEGPTPHGSNWQRPGQEWGTTFVFPVSGCWDLHVSRTNIVGDIKINVVPAFSCASQVSALVMPATHEVQGMSSNTNKQGAQLWALVHSETWPPKTNTPVVFDVRTTGVGRLNIDGLGPGGSATFPVGDVTLHNTSWWSRPGVEWTVSLSFPVSGCWDLEVQTDDFSGDLPITVS